MSYSSVSRSHFTIIINLRYYLLSTLLDLFSIPDSTVGKITVAGEIDKEMINDEIVFEVTATDSAENTDTVSNGG